MKLPRLFNQQQIKRDNNGKLAVGHIRGVPDICRDTGAMMEPAAWFLGPSAENEALLKSMIEDGRSTQPAPTHRRHRWPYFGIRCVEHGDFIKQIMLTLDSKVRALVEEWREGGIQQGVES